MNFFLDLICFFFVFFGKQNLPKKGLRKDFKSVMEGKSKPLTEVYTSYRSEVIRSPTVAVVDLKEGQREAKFSRISEKASSHGSCWINEAYALWSERRNTAETALRLQAIVPHFGRKENRMQYCELKCGTGNAARLF